MNSYLYKGVYVQQAIDRILAGQVRSGTIRSGESFVCTVQSILLALKFVMLLLFRWIKWAVHHHQRAYVGTLEDGEKATNVRTVGGIVSAVEVVEASAYLKSMKQFIGQVVSIDDLGGLRKIGTLGWNPEY